MKAEARKSSGEMDAEAERRFAALARRFTGDPAVSRGGMFGGVDLRMSGKVFAVLYKNQFVVKLPKSRVADLVAAGEGRNFNPGHGRIMREWLSLPAGSRLDWLPLAREAMAFVGGAKHTTTARRKA